MKRPSEQLPRFVCWVKTLHCDVGTTALSSTYVKLLGDDGCRAETSEVNHWWHRGPMHRQSARRTSSSHHCQRSRRPRGCVLGSLQRLRSSVHAPWLAVPPRLQTKCQNIRRNCADHHQSRHTRTSDRQPPRVQLPRGGQTSDATTAILSGACRSRKLNWSLLGKTHVKCGK